MKVLQIACVVDQDADPDVIKAAQEVDERHAWDAFAAAYATVSCGSFMSDLAGEAASFADALLEERRKRWGSK